MFSKFNPFSLANLFARGVAKIRFEEVLAMLVEICSTCTIASSVLFVLGSS